MDGSGMAIFHASTSDRNGKQMKGTEVRGGYGTGQERTGSLSCVHTGKDRIGVDWRGSQGIGHLSCIHKGLECIGMDRSGEDRKGVLSGVHNGMEWTGKDWNRVDGIGVFFKPRENER